MANIEAVVDAIRAGDLGRVRELLEAEPSLVAETSGNVSLLLLSLYHGQAAIAREFAARREISFPEACALGRLDLVGEIAALDPEAVNRLSDDGFPPLGLAIFFGHPEVAARLVELGANVNQQADNAARVAPLHAAATVSDAASVELLLARRADPNARQQNGYTPLHSAASRGDRRIAELLLHAGADPKASSDDGKTAGSIALERGHADFAEWIGRV